jgi:hypothetical protein
MDGNPRWVEIGCASCLIGLVFFVVCLLAVWVAPNREAAVTELRFLAALAIILLGAGYLAARTAQRFRR